MRPTTIPTTSAADGLPTHYLVASRLERLAALADQERLARLHARPSVAMLPRLRARAAILLIRVAQRPQPTTATVSVVVEQPAPVGT